MLLIYLFLITSLFGCFYTSAEASPTYISSPRPAPVSGPAHSALLWKISGAQPSWIYATLRTADPRAAIPPARILSALRLSHSYHPDIELSAGIEIALAGKLMLDGQPDLSTRLPPATWDRALAAADQIGLPEILLHRMSPGVAALAFANPPGLDVNESMDARLRDAARDAGLPITPLETLDEHLADFDALPELGARALLTQVLGQTASASRRDATLVAAFVAGDENTLARLLVAEFPRSPAATALTAPLLYTRNARLAARISEQLRRGGAFISVGVGHLVGPKNVLQLLAAQGWKISRAP